MVEKAGALNWNNSRRAFFRLRASIAVLPFADMSQEQDQQYFCEGVAEEIISRLAQIKALRVVSRTSAFQMRALTNDLRELGRRLRVGTVLEGSVRNRSARPCRKRQRQQRFLFQLMRLGRARRRTGARRSLHRARGNVRKIRPDAR